MQVLVTGGAGYIGSHTCVELLQEGYEVVVVDNLSNSSMESVNRVQEITGKKVEFHQVDLLDKTGLEAVFHASRVDAVIHFAGLKAVGESVEIPISYYLNNVAGTLVLCEVMKEKHVRNIVFSSSSTVYGNPTTVPVTEAFPVSAVNPYGRSKLMVETILKDIYISDNSWNVTLLRYFNPIGAHPSGRIGEDPAGIPNNLLPYISQVAVGKLKELSVFGNDYPTRDGTGIRDYIHVVDLARGHIKALAKMETSQGGVLTYNLGTGRGYSVLEMINAFERVSGKKIPFKIVGRRPGDIASCYADPSLARKELEWSTEFGLEDMCRDVWRWQSNNPDGYQGL